MRKFMFAGALALAGTVCAPSDAQAFGRRSKTKATTVTTTSTVTTAVEKSEVQARTGRMAHVGRLLPGLREGVGFSTRSAQEALDSCCYSNSGLPVVEQAVVRGANGWFATRIYAASRSTCVNGSCK